VTKQSGKRKRGGGSISPSERRPRKDLHHILHAKMAQEIVIHTPREIDVEKQIRKGDALKESSEREVKIQTDHR